MTFLLLNMTLTYYSSWENWFFKKDQLFFPICFYLFSCPFVMYFKNMKKKITKTHFEIFNNSLISLTPGPLCIGGITMNPIFKDAGWNLFGLNLYEFE